MANQSVADLYRSRKAEGTVVDVTLPSGIVFKFRRPSVLKMVLTNGLPLSLAAEMTAKGPKAGTTSEDIGKIDELVQKLRKLLHELSVEPKIVFAETEEPNELFIDDVEDRDLEYLVAWVSNGGDVSAPALNDFRQGQGPDVVGGARRKRLGVASK